MEDNPEYYDELQNILAEGRALCNEMKPYIGAVTAGQGLKISITALLSLEIITFHKLTKIYNSGINRGTSLIEFSALARLLIESFSMACWILEVPEKQLERSRKFNLTGSDLVSHYNRIGQMGGKKIRRTRSRTKVSTSKTLEISSKEIPTITVWYDELNYFLHPTTSLMQETIEQRANSHIDFGVSFAIDILAVSIQKFSSIMGLSNAVINQAKDLFDSHTNHIYPNRKSRADNQSKM
jgi:hypothetical protein